MRTPIYAATIAATLLGATATTDNQPKAPYSQRMATSIMSRSQGIMTGTGGSSEALQAGFVQRALTVLSEQYPDDTAEAQAYIRSSVSSTTLFLSNATNDVDTFPLDRLSTGNVMLRCGGSTSATTTALSALRRSVDLNPRNSEGGLWYFVYPNWSYLDGMFSYAPFFTLYTLTKTANAASVTSALDDMLNQLDLLWSHTIHPSGLLSHGYDETRTAVWANPVTGASPEVWGRAMGWYTMALADTIEILVNKKGPAKYVWALLEKFQALMPAVMNNVEPHTGGWLQIVDQFGREGNYIESSGTAMFTYSLLKGARLGYLPKQVAPKAVQVATRAYNYLVDNFVVEEHNGTLSYNGTVSVCSLNSTANYDYYVHQPIQFNSVLGSGAFVLASVEMERLVSPPHH
ncbi:Six-hairpin glycosidase-like protein [Xylaria sp. CBS 124048]|nr:Six-hairpin glycosidase-like protein [Xylaria sp. CBS 124048]